MIADLRSRYSSSGYWHSGPDSPKLHRCPFQPACGNPAGGSGTGDRWPADAAAAAAMAPAAVVVLNSSSTQTLLPLSGSSSSGSSSLFGVLAQSSLESPRSQWLARCQLLGYLQVSGGANSNSSTDANSTAAAMLKGCTEWRQQQVAAEAAAGGAEAVGSSGSSSGAAVAPYQQLQCAEGYTGNLCGACSPGYFLNSEQQCM